MRHWRVLPFVFFLPCFALPATAAPVPIGFDEALSVILERSTGVATQNANLGAAEANALPAKFAFAPSLSFDAGKTRTSSSHVISTSSQIEAVAKLNLIHWGADLAQLHAADLDTESQRATLDLAWLKTEEAGVEALITQIQRRLEIDINEEIVKSQFKLQDIARERYARGYLPLQEADKISVDLENANASLADSQLREIESRNQLENLLGRSDLVVEWPWRDRLTHVDVAKIAGSSLDLAARPDWLAASRKREAEEQRYRRDWGLLLPSVDGSFAYGRYSGFEDDTGVIGSGNVGWTGTVTVTLPFFDHLVSYSNLRAQAFTREAAETAVTQVERDARADWEAARTAFSTALATALAREKIIDTSRKIYTDNLKRFQMGRISVNDLAIDQKRLFDSELFAVQGWGYAHLAFSRLCHSVGRRVTSCP